MAKKQARPGRRLILFGLAVALLYGAVALGGVWKPKLGLDLQGGTRITLEASTEAGDDPTAANLEEARGIIDQRVNGSGVAESEVGTQGANQIVVEIPGENRSDLVDAVKATAQLRFRLVAAVSSGAPQPTPSPSGSPPRRRPQRLGLAAGDPQRQAVRPPKASSGATPKGRALSSGLVAADEPRPRRPRRPVQAQARRQRQGQHKPSAAPSASAAPLGRAGKPEARRR